MIKKRSRCAGIFLLLSGTFLFFPVVASAEPLTLKNAVELALRHANGAAIAMAEQKSVAADYRDMRNSYLPQITVGSGLGPSYGYPLALAGSAPAIFNVTAQSALFHPELQSFIHSASSEFAAAGFRTKDERNQIIQDTVLSYAELEKWEQRLDRLREIYPDVQKMEAAVAERVKEGIDSELDETRARLSEARMRLRMAEAQGSSDVLREHLSKLTGLPAAGLQTEGDTLPAFPATASDESAPERAANDSPAYKSSVEHARAEFLKAQGEHRMWMPELDFAAQYAELSTFNNYQDYFQPVKPCVTSIGTLLCPSGTFQRSNATLGVSIRIPIFNGSQRARAQAADAEAAKAREQADATHSQLSEQTLRLQRAVMQSQAARDVAELEYEIAQKDVGAVETRIKAGTANLHDMDNARTQESEKLIALQDVSFALERSQIELLRSTGDLESWALGTK